MDSGAEVNNLGQNFKFETALGEGVRLDQGRCIDA